MNDLERDLRTLFDAKSGDAPTAPKPPTNLLRRARARQLRTAFVAGLGVIAIIVGSVAGIRAIVTADGTTPADQPTETITMNGVSTTHPEGWALIDPDEAGLNGSGPDAGLPRLILALSPIDTGELLACPGMVEGTRPTSLMTLQEEPLATGGPDATPWPVELAPLSFESEGAAGGTAAGGCYPGWEFLRAGWTAAGRTFEARVGFDPGVTDEDRLAVLDAFASMTFEASGTELESAVLATGSAGGEEWQLIARRQSDGLSLSLDAETFGTGSGGYGDNPNRWQLSSHVFGEYGERDIVVFGPVPLAATTVEAIPAAGSPTVSVDILDVPDQIDAGLNAFVLVADADLPVDLIAYDAAGNIILEGRTGELDFPEPTPSPDEVIFEGRTNDCLWTLSRASVAPGQDRFDLTTEDISVGFLAEMGPDAPPLQLSSFTCPLDPAGTLVFGLITEDVVDMRWPTSGSDEHGRPECWPADIPERFCLFILDGVGSSGEAIALDEDGNEIGRVPFP